MLMPFSRTHDLGRVFDAGSLNRDLVLIGSAGKVSTQGRDDRGGRGGGRPHGGVGKHGAAPPAMKVEDIDFLFGPAPDQMAT